MFLRDRVNNVVKDIVESLDDSVWHCLNVEHNS